MSSFGVMRLSAGYRPPYIKGYCKAQGQNVSTQFDVKKNDMLIVGGNSVGTQYETTITGSIEKVTEWHQIYSTDYQKVFKVTADDVVTLTNKTTGGSSCYIISKGGSEIDCQSVASSANSSVTVSSVKENELFMAYTSNTNYTILKPSSDNKTLQIFDSHQTAGSLYAAALRAVSDSDSVTLNAGYYVTEILRFA